MFTLLQHGACVIAINVNTGGAGSTLKIGVCGWLLLVVVVVAEAKSCLTGLWLRNGGSLTLGMNLFLLIRRTRKASPTRTWNASLTKIALKFTPHVSVWFCLLFFCRRWHGLTQDFATHAYCMYPYASFLNKGDIEQDEELTHTYISLEWRTCFSELNDIVNGGKTEADA